MNLYELVNSKEVNWGNLHLGPITLNFEKVNVSEVEEGVIIRDGGVALHISKSVRFEFEEEDKCFIRFRAVGHECHLSLHKKK